MFVFEQCTNLIFCVLLQKSPALLLTMSQQAYCDIVAKTSQMCDWHKLFHDRRDSVDDDTHRSCPSTSKMQQMSIVCKRLWEIDIRKSVDQTATEFGISVGSRHSILHDILNMRCFRQHLVPWMLTPENKINTNEDFRWHCRCVW